MSSLRTLSEHGLHVAWVRHGAAVFLVLHGIAHLVGAQAAIDAAGGGEAVELLFGSVTVAGVWAPVLAVAWIAVAAGFALVAAWLWVHHVRWWDATVVVLAASLAMSVLALPQAVAGVAINLVLLAVALLVRDAAVEVVRW